MMSGVIFAQAADSTSWWQGTFVPLGVVLAAFIAGGFAVYNARKTPHENLKSLLEIRESISDHLATLDPEQEIEAAIKHEISNLGELRKAARQGWWAYQAEKISQSETWASIFLHVNSAAIAFLFAAAIADREKAVRLLSILAMVVLMGIFSAVLLFQVRSHREGRRLSSRGTSPRVYAVRHIFPVAFIGQLMLATLSIFLAGGIVVDSPALF